MNGTIFDLVEDDIPEGKEGFFEIAKRAPQPKDDSFLSQVSDFGKTILKGGIEGVSRLGMMMSGTPIGQNKQELLENQTETLNEYLPTDEKFIQSGLRRGLKEAPSMMAFPGSAIQAGNRSILAGFFGEGAKELGAPEWAQTAAELTAYMGPDITKKLLESGKNKEIIEGARKLGLTDEQITPLIQSEFKQKWLSKFTTKRGSTQKALGNTKQALSETYGKLQKSEEASKFLSDEANEKLTNSLSENLFKMPAGVRSKIEKDTADLINQPITGESLINYYTDINYNLGPKTKQLSILKEPIKEAIEKVSPKLKEDLELINKLYTKYYPIASKLKPNLTSDIISAAESLGVIGGLITGYYPIFISTLGEKLGKKIVQQMLINPRLQQLSRKTVDSINQNKYGIVKKLIDLYKYEVNKISPDIAKQITDISEDELKKLFFTDKK